MWDKIDNFDFNFNFLVSKYSVYRIGNGVFVRFTCGSNCGKKILTICGDDGDMLIEVNYTQGQ